MYLRGCIGTMATMGGLFQVTDELPVSNLAEDLPALNRRGLGLRF